MNGTVKKAAIVVLAIIALACLGVSIATGQTPFITGVLVCAGIIVVCITWLIRQRKTIHIPSQDAPSLMASEKNNPQSMLARQYSHLKQSLLIPDNSQFIQMPTTLLPFNNVNLLYYCWKTDTHLTLFPQWDSLETSLGLLGYLESHDSATPIYLHVISIPLSSIICFTKEPYDQNVRSFTLLHYHNSLGDNVGLLMQEDAYSVLKSLIPHMDLGIIQSQRYPQSAQQILDITTKLQQLKALHMQALIDEQEYAAKKIQLLTTL